MKIKEWTVECYDHVINSTDVKYLGISIDKYLNCEHDIVHVSSIINKVNSRLKFLYRNAKFLDTRSRMTLTTVLIQCYLDKNDSYNCTNSVLFR
jgi:hypothetical protein